MLTYEKENVHLGLDEVPPQQYASGANQRPFGR